MEPQALQSFCQTLPGTTEDIKWEEHLTFCVGEKMYAILSHDDAGRANISLKTQPDLFDAQITQPHITPAPYLARYKWILVKDLERVDETELRALITTSYQLIRAKLPARVKRRLFED